jgi:hypothetical protein
METDVHAFLASYPPSVRDLAWKLRALVCEVIPHVWEHVETSDQMMRYGLGPTMADSICVIAPYTSHVILMFGKGSELPDPAGLLKGTEHHVRALKIMAASDIAAPALRTLLEQAVAAQHS